MWRIEEELHSYHDTFRKFKKKYVCIHSCLQKFWALDIYKHINISSVLWEGLFTSNQSNVDKHVISSICWAWISSCDYMLMIFLHQGMFSKIKTFPRCTPYIIICIYWYIYIYQGLKPFANSCTYMYICTTVCNKFEALIYISIYIYGVHCG